VLYRKEFAVFAYSETEGTLAYSSVGAINDQYFANQVAGTAKSATIDSNYDLKPDLYDFNFTLTTNPANIRNVKVLTMFDYALEEIVTEEMVVMAFASVDTPIGASTVYLEGDLELH
jgi:hypothetical protein